MSPREVLAHDRALADWLEAEALVVSLRRSARLAAERAVERERTAALLVRSGRRDARAAGAADAARLLAQRALAEERRLAEALREEARLRARVAETRGALVGATDAEPATVGPRARCA